MKDLSIPTRLYLLSIFILGGFSLLINIINWQSINFFMLVVLCVLASLSLIIKVEGATNRSHYTFSFIFYGFALIHLGVPGAVVVIIVSNLVEWLVNRPAWYIQLFNTACYIFVINISGLVFQWINSDLSLTTPVTILAISASMLVYTLLNHFIVGIVVWMARGENFKQSGIFDLLPIIIDLTLMTLGTMLALVWAYNPFALILFAFPIYLLYDTLRVPALERQTVTDQKTGLYNHHYFMQHFQDELERANRYDRPLTVIMADLDLLRNINNTYGHLAGDEVLIKIANILQNSVREYDVVARFGGEEFSILLPETDLNQAYDRAEEIRQAVGKAEFIIPTSVTPIEVTLSLGVAHRDGFDQTPQNIIHNADTALYHSKLKGRNRAYAYTKDAYVDFAGRQSDKHEFHETEANSILSSDTENRSDGHAYQASSAKIYHAPDTEQGSLPENKEKETRKTSSIDKKSKQSVNIFIGGIFILACLLFGGLFFVAPGFYTITSMPSWIGISVSALLVILTERYSIDLYTRKTSLSISAVPILVGSLLFGPISLIILSATYAISTGLKYRSPMNRYVFNFSNQLLAGMIYSMIIPLSGQSFLEWASILQLCFAILAIIIVFLLNTSLITIGMHLDTGQPMVTFWKEHYSWLFTIYISMGVIAAAIIFGYKHAPLIGPILAIVPLLVLRYSQVHYVNRTQAMVTEMRDKNATLKKTSEEITLLNEGLLETLAEVIDLRDPYVLGHSQKVANLATQIANRMGLHEEQVTLIRNASLLHDIGKFGISENILTKPAELSIEEYEIIKTHPDLGATILQKSPYLRPLIPSVRHHHEKYNGEGYPDKLKKNEIPIEARIVAVADAVEAMSSDRPYRKARSKEQIIDELKNHTGIQFDPLVAETAIDLLAEAKVQKGTEITEINSRIPISDSHTF